MRLSDCESALLALLDEAGETGMSERDIAVRLHRSQSEVNRLIVNLASVGIITFTFNGTRFVIARNDE
jgi:predicted transcriptional regulator